MNTALLELTESDEVVPMIGLPTEQPAKRELTNSVDDVLRSIDALRTALILDVLETRTAVDFKHAFREAFPQYLRLLRSFSEIVATVPTQAMVRMSVESLNELETNLRARSEECFGPEMTERALFTVFSLRKITRLLYSVTTSKRKLASCDVQKDRSFAKNFHVSAVVARFSIDCLVVAMERNRTIYPEVLAALDDFMRSVVNAYAWVRQAVDLRTERQLIDMDAAYPSLEAEDRQLLNESMRDLALGHN